VGAARVCCIHINDSKKELGTRVDRHEHIGKGCFGRDGLRWIVHEPRFREVPFIFELPPEGDMVRRNLAALRKLAGARVKRGSSRAPAAGSPRR
jgi:deoxyribonuclease-4